MQTLYIVGGGRWARVVASEALKIGSPALQIVLVSAKNELGMQKWIEDNFKVKQLIVKSKIPKIVLDNSYAYVVNETKNRFETLSALLINRMPVLVEKPFMLNYKHCEEIINLYKSNEIFIASSQVFRFMSGLHAIKEVVSLDKTLSIEFSWCDKIQEVRYGETKTFEKDVPIYFDILPHIYSILCEIFGGLPMTLIKVKSEKDSNEFLAAFKYNNNIDINIFISRISRKRIRNMQIKSVCNLISFDFTAEECLQISCDGKIVCEKNFGKSNGIQRMLSAFLQSQEGAPPDSRLETDTVFTVTKMCEVIQQELTVY